MIYVPGLENYVCVYVKDSDTIRAYKSQPVLNGSSEYVDYYYNSNYYYTEGVENFIESIPVCLNNDKLTNDFYYRNDINNILFIFLVFAIFAVCLPIYIIMKLFKKRSI